MASGDAGGGRKGETPKVARTEADVKAEWLERVVPQMAAGLVAARPFTAQEAARLALAYAEAIWEELRRQRN